MMILILDLYNRSQCYIHFVEFSLPDMQQKLDGIVVILLH
jgi:hypothetical protein